MANIISVLEFGFLLRRCLPPNTNIISIAHSGGPDSTCLLYLLNAWLKTQTISPLRIISLIVDHQLQSASAFVAKQASKYALSLGIPSYILTIPWSIPPYPPRPSNEQAFETIARQARYDILQSEMKKHNSSVLAMGHHADDNVETLLMRMNNRVALSSESEILSTLRPIRFCRRIGMSNSDKLLGMHQWIVRPLLPVPKSRILATCEHYGIPYAVDQTNFQPSVTSRNFVRRCLQMRMETAVQIAPIHPPARSRLTIDAVNKSISMLDSIAEKHAPYSRACSLSKRLYSAVEYVSKNHLDIDKQVTTFLFQSARPSPVSTLIVSLNQFNASTSISHHIIRRILRYVSPSPWGHPSAEVFGSSTNLVKISKLLWSTNLSSEEKRPFTLGSQVIWRPCVGKDRHGRQIPYWIAARQPPIRRNNAVNPCITNITHLIKSQEETMQSIWDNRFLVIIRPALIPGYIQALFASHTDAQVVIAPYTNWFLPRIEFRYDDKKSKEFVVLTQYNHTPTTPFSFHDRSPYNSRWIQIEFMRVIDSI